MLRQAAWGTDFLLTPTPSKHSVHGHRHYHSAGSGHVCRNRFTAFFVAEDDHLLAVFRYVERNPLRDGMVARAEDWP